MYRYDSRAIQPGDTFIVLPKGEAHLEEAYRKGAVSHVQMDRPALAAFADRHFGFPSQKLTVIGVTGTNGKTTVTHLVHQGLEFSGKKSRLLGTLNAPLTTPESLDIHQMMAEHVAAGGTHFVMEVSSHGIAQHRIDGIRFAIKLLTNITPDHLDFHRTFEAYQDTKLRFMAQGDGLALYPADFSSLPIPHAPHFVGAFNQRNLQAAARILGHLGLTPDDMSSFFLSALPPPGRFESIYAGQPTLAIVDFAHTPDGLENVLQT
ncbi:MAG: Mur ligase family protein, partial [Candidatus Margulisiibacteriota bacterium]